MRKIYPLPLLFALVALVLTACQKDTCEESWTNEAMVPILASRQQVQDSIGVEEPITLCTGGGLYAYGNWVFINRSGEGYHLLDNSDPADPQNVAFLRVPGATQMAFVDGHMVSDSYADLVTMEFGGADQLTVLNSTPNLLNSGSFAVTGDTIVVGYELRDVTYTEDCSGNVQGYWGDYANRGFALDAAFESGGAGNASGVNTAGSLSKFAFDGEYLYVLGDWQLDTYRMDDRGALTSTNTQSPGWGLETAVVRDDHLYLGSMTGMFIYSLADPAQPRFLSEATHFTACDPVAVEGDRAVVTLRGGGDRCGNPEARNVMLVYDISDKINPELLTEVELSGPIGVALHDGYAYVCDDAAGLKVFDLDGGAIQELDERMVQVVDDAQFTDVAVLDYPGKPVLLTIGDSHVSQFLVGDDGSLERASVFSADHCVGL